MTTAHQLAQPLINRLLQALVNRNTPLFVALDGRSGSGKSTIAAIVAEALGTDHQDRPIVTIIEGDQFYGGGNAATWDQRSTEEKVATVIDWKRQRTLLESLRDAGAAIWYAFDWESDDWDADIIPLSSEPIRCSATPIILLEGAYSARPELSDLLDLRVLLEIPRERRRAQLLAREGEEYRADWEERWVSAENHYFGTIVPAKEFDLVLSPTTT